jgi:hypothetical protein
VQDLLQKLQSHARAYLLRSHKPQCPTPAPTTDAVVQELDRKVNLLLETNGILMKKYLETTQEMNEDNKSRIELLVRDIKRDPGSVLENMLSDLKDATKQSEYYRKLAEQMVAFLSFTQDP